MPTNVPKKKSSEPFFQFPLCALAYGGTPKERLNAILDYAVLETGETIWRGYDTVGQKLLVSSWKNDTRLPADINLDRPLHQAVMAGATSLRVRMPPLDQLVRRHDDLMRFVNKHGDLYGASPQVRIRHDLFFEARDGKGVSYPEFTVLAAIYSVIGKKQSPPLICQSTIRHRALGYKSPTVQEAELGRRTDGAQPLTEWQLRRTLERLHERKLFARFTYARRLTYYSHKMTDIELRAAIVARKSYRAVFQWNRKRADQEATDKIRNARASTTA